MSFREREWEDQRKDPDDAFFHARDGLAEAKTTSRAMPAKRCQDRWIRRPGKPALCHHFIDGKVAP
jgi:hypothetical protein